MKRNKFLRTAAVLLALVLVTTCGMVGTLAKYVESFNSATKTVRAGLFYVVGDTTDLTFTEFEGSGSGADAQIKAYNDDAILVPGMVLAPTTSPVSKAVITNYSEVSVKVAVTGVTIGGVKAWDGLLIKVPTLNSGNWMTLGAFNALSAAEKTEALTVTTPVLAAYADSAASTTNVTPNFQILWPYSRDDATAVGYKDGATEIDWGSVTSHDNYKTGNTDSVDTAIGLQQTVDLFDVDAAEVPCNKACLTTKDPATCTEGDCVLHEKGLENAPCNGTNYTSHLGTCAYKPTTYKLPVSGVDWTVGGTTNELSISFTIQAVQVD